MGKDIATVAVWVILGLLLLWGWILNCLKLLQIIVTGTDVAGAESVTRVFGAIFWPFGSVMGFF